MKKHFYKLFDIINGKLTGRDPELVRRLRKELVNVLEVKKESEGLFDISGETIPYCGIECGQKATVHYKESFYPHIDYINREIAIRRDLTKRIFHDSLLSAVDNYIIVDDRPALTRKYGIVINSQIRKATYQGIAITRFSTGPKRELINIDPEVIERMNTFVFGGQQ